MRLFQISTDLWMELGDDGVVRVVSRAMQSDRDPDCAGVVVVYQDEIDSLVAALEQAGSVLRFRPKQEQEDQCDSSPGAVASSLLLLL